MKKMNFKNSFFKNEKFKYSGLSTIIVVVFIVCLIGVNVLGSFLSERFTGFSIDMTYDSEYTISEKNKEYIEKIDKPVEIVVTCTEDYYLNEYISSISQTYTDSSGGKYFKQTIALLKNYQKINSNITVKFLDSSKPDFNKYADKYSDSNLSYGDIVVDYTYKTKDGKEKTNYKVVTFDDVYEIGTDSSGSSTGVISGSNLETSVTSALYYVIQKNKSKIALITGYGSADVSDYVKTLATAGYDYVEISDLNIDSIPKDATMIMLAAPTVDLSQSDIKKLDEFLLGKAGDNKFDYGTTFIYFASSVQSNLPNLDAFLEDWGIGFKQGTVFETNSNNCGESNTDIRFDLNTDDADRLDFVDELNSSYYYMADNNRPMKLLFDQKSKFNTYSILNTSDSCVIRPYNVSDNWSASDENTSVFSEVALSRYVTEDTKKNTARFSNVIAVASTDFIGSNALSVDYNANVRQLLSVINGCAGRVQETYDVETRVIDYTKFEPTDVQSNTVKIVSKYIVPIAIALLGVVLFVIRKRR